jgi:hypothetical protein
MEDVLSFRGLVKIRHLSDFVFAERCLKNVRNVDIDLSSITGHVITGGVFVRIFRWLCSTSNYCTVHRLSISYEGAAIDELDGLGSVLCAFILSYRLFFFRFFVSGLGSILLERSKDVGVRNFKLTVHLVCHNHRARQILARLLDSIKTPNIVYFLFIFDSPLNYMTWLRGGLREALLSVLSLSPRSIEFIGSNFFSIANHPFLKRILCTSPNIFCRRLSFQVIPNILLENPDYLYFYFPRLTSFGVTTCEVERMDAVGVFYRNLHINSRSMISNLSLPFYSAEFVCSNILLNMRHVRIDCFRHPMNDLRSFCDELRVSGLAASTRFRSIWVNFYNFDFVKDGFEITDTFFGALVNAEIIRIQFPKESRISDVPISGHILVRIITDLFSYHRVQHLFFDSIDCGSLLEHARFFKNIQCPELWINDGIQSWNLGVDGFIAQSIETMCSRYESLTY